MDSWLHILKLKRFAKKANQAYQLDSINHKEKNGMSIWQGLGIFFLGCFVGANVGILILGLCKAAGDADRLNEETIKEFINGKKEI
jgi:hypothetical protein